MPAEPVHYCYQIYKASIHPNVCNVSAPHLVTSFYVYPSEKTGTDLVFFSRSVLSPGTGIYGHQRHLFHESVDSFTIQCISKILPVQQFGHSSNTTANDSTSPGPVGQKGLRRTEDPEAAAEIHTPYGITFINI